MRRNFAIFLGLLFLFSFILSIRKIINEDKEKNKRQNRENRENRENFNYDNITEEEQAQMYRTYFLPPAERLEEQGGVLQEIYGVEPAGGKYPKTSPYAPIEDNEGIPADVI